WKQKFLYDFYYVRYFCFLLDLKFFRFTVLKFFKKEGVNQSDDRPMLPFDGTN
ncbi:MAG: lipid carrier--UDP-N-acetylgalactosaminyltransferase, partial [Flavobacterium sp.]|nr:lipid carrier--UDP-N-acetylgalactosaminyltransferase [Flavobacterium sp.]